MSPERETTLQEYLRGRRLEIEEALQRFLSPSGHGHASIVDAMGYSLFAGGKRFRPVLTLAAADAVSDGSAEGRRRAMPAACAIEMIHTYSLIHDDLPAMDNDTLRRGKPTNHVVYGEGLAILAGDGLHAEAFGLIAREPGSTRDPELTARKLAVVQLVATAAGSAGMVGGQAIDLQVTGHGSGVQGLTPDGLRTMHACKTGALIRASAAAGAIMAGGTETQRASIDTYASSLGLAFQIVDDILDVEATAADLGKSVGKDAAANKPTYPMFFGLDQSRRLARTATDDALAALAAAGMIDSRLAEIAEWLVARTS
jgi:geranylgeranyl diphosphate synthase type II